MIKHVIDMSKKGINFLKPRQTPVKGFDLLPKFGPGIKKDLVVQNSRNDGLTGASLLWKNCPCVVWVSYYHIYI